MDHG